jgi:oligopeptide/dipeptide ABC transporter ATP-binding protein
VLIADEPTTALDVTVQARVMRLLHGLSREGMGLLLITHDLALVAQLADRVAVMYAGSVVESAPAVDLFARPAHPYTAALLQTQPRLGAGRGRLPVIEGRVPAADARGAGCAFAARCTRADRRCGEQAPPRVDRAPGHWVECHHPLAGTAAGDTDVAR